MGRPSYVVTARERVLALVDGDIREYDANPGRDAELVYDGAVFDEARTAAWEFVSGNPCEFLERGLSAAVAFWSVEGVLFEDEDAEPARCGALCATSLTAAARERLRRFADGVDETLDELGW